MASTKPHVLVIDDDEFVVEILRTYFRTQGFVVEARHDLAGVAALPANRSYAAILLDLHLGPEPGLFALPFLLQRCRFKALFLMSADGVLPLLPRQPALDQRAFALEGKNALQLAALVMALSRDPAAPYHHLPASAISSGADLPFSAMYTYLAPGFRALAQGPSRLRDAVEKQLRQGGLNVSLARETNGHPWLA